MERKTKIQAEEGKQQLTITREFELPLELLFKAYEDPEIVEQWMGTKVLKLENKKHGNWCFETSAPDGTVIFRASGVYHEFIPQKRITRTFEMDPSPFDVQLEFFEFEKLTENTSKLTMQIVYRSIGLRDQMLQLPFAAGLNMAHDRLEQLLKKD